ncbi:STAS domain-containing protein [Streptomyces sp. KAI-26]|uniref:STAS domain-containing protein n=1 Tax=Streptomyces TaxID=1883 RepID=UPI00158653F2|nr:MULTISPECIES: STAS domain-containing protein [Streptomyces]NUV41111.1 STAS domain-containing protein [Streptomyces sp. CAI-24]NUV85207.1 STAS domain-containing protein [Streptomyces sp. KAI-26]NUW19194.1 STAS domain-containing protein [Streptomyces roseoviolaceus]
MTALPSPLLTVTAEEGPGWVRLRLTGDLDYDTSSELVARAMEQLAARPGLDELYLDCAGLEMCDSMGVSALLQVHRDTAARRVRLHVEEAPPFLDRIMRITGIDHLFARQEQKDRRPARGAGEEGLSDPHPSPTS